MKYLCLVYGDEKQMENMPDAHCLEYVHALHEMGVGATK
jgi:hypothetical protein